MILLTNTPIQKLEPFTVTLVLSESPGCNMVNLETYNAEIKPKCIVLTESDIPSECKDSYNYISIKNSLTSNEYKLYAYNYKDYTEIYQNSFYNKSDVGSFQINVFMKSPYCTDYKFVEGFYATKNKSRVIEITDKDIPYDCQKKYMVCFNLKSIPYKYNMKYSLSYEPYEFLYNVVYAENKFIYNAPFSVKIYLSDSSVCGDKMLLTEIEASGDSECMDISENIIPDQCKIEAVSPDENTKSKGVSVVAIAGISGVAVIIISIIVAVTIYLVRKKNNKVYDTNSQTLGSSLLTENYGSTSNF